MCGCQVVRSVDGSEWGEIVVEIWFCYVYRKELRLRYAMWKFANFHLNAFGFAIIGLILREGKFCIIFTLI